MGVIASVITSLTIVYSTVYLDADQKQPKLRVTGLCVGNSPGTAKMTSNAENISIDDVIMFSEIYIEIRYFSLVRYWFR